VVVVTEAALEIVEEPTHVTKLRKLVRRNKKRIAEHFDDLQRRYFDYSLYDSGRLRDSGLEEFSSTVSGLTRFSHFEHLSTLRYGDIFNASSIVSSIEFDRDDEYFATAGVTKKIKIFEFGNIEKSGLGGSCLKDDEVGEVDGNRICNKRSGLPIPQYPIKEMNCRSKIRYKEH
jgi:E3 ubiquitin-protein ligase RFWD2